VASQFNTLVEDIVRAGVGGPWCLGSGFVIVETRGRKSGMARKNPVLAQRIGNTLFVSTVRQNSQWVKNLVADAAPRVFVDKKSQPVRVTLRRFGRWTVLRLDIQKDVAVAN
jgi:F420H(2)-dependent quinone reductase